MAEEKDKDKAKKTDDKAPSGAAKANGGPLPPNILFLAIIGGIVVVNLLVVIIMAASMKPPKQAPDQATTADSVKSEESGEGGKEIEQGGEEKASESATHDGAEKEGKKESEKKGSHESGEEEFPKKPIEAVCNIAGTNGDRVLKIAVKPAFKVSGKKSGGGGGHGGGGGPLDPLEPKAKDILIDVVSQMTLSELSEPDARDKIRKEFMHRLNSVVPKHMHLEITNVYIDMFIIQ